MVLNLYFIVIKVTKWFPEEIVSLSDFHLLVSKTLLNLNSFQEISRNLFPNMEQKTFLLALSGGADSMVLANLMLLSGYKFQVAHVNYQLREEASNLDQKVVEDFCEKNNLSLHLYSVSEKDNKPKNSIQLWARNLRYDFFFRILEQEKLDFVATAHHLNDELETFFIHLSRGSGIKGLSGIPKNENRIFRPLLQFSKDEIYLFAKENTIEFREDASNKKTDYLRNKFRNSIVPKLLEIEPYFLQNFSKSLYFLSEVNEFVESASEEIFHRISQKIDGNFLLEKENLAIQKPLVRHQILKKFGFHSAEEIEKIFTAHSGSSFFSATHQLLIDRENIWLIGIAKNEIQQNEIQQDAIILLASMEDAENNNFEIDVKKFVDFSDFPESLKNKIWIFNLDKIVFPLLLRKKKEGDFFHPIGMQGKKKVSKFFKDEKISILAKPKIWILVDASDCVLGVLPFRQDGRKSSVCEKVNNLKVILG
jgi:tRNA(Ile)-lysidine synthase